MIDHRVRYAPHNPDEAASAVPLLIPGQTESSLVDWVKNIAA